MILVDTSIWVDHFRAADPLMERAAAEGVVLHPFAFVEICLGSFHARQNTIRALRQLPWLLPIRQHEISAMIENDRLYSTGLDFVDLHQLASARATAGCKIWTRDKRLRTAAERFGVASNFL